MSDFAGSQRTQLADVLARILRLNIANLEIITVDQFNAFIGGDFDTACREDCDAPLPHDQIVAWKSNKTMH